MQLSSRLSLLVVGLLMLTAASGGNLTAYWNVPLENCFRLGVTFDLDQFNIVHNSNNTFKGDKVNILYQPGQFPHYTLTGDPVNGGIPQLGNLSLHLTTFRQQLQFLPSNYTGLLVLDFELYLPSFSVSLPSVYRDQSFKWVQHQHPNWTYEAILHEAQRTFNASVKPYFEVLLQEASQRYPASLVGFYHYPYCEDYKPPFLHCALQLQDLNDDLRTWLLDSSHALYPSVYLQRRFSPARQWRVVRAKLAETQRIRKQDVPVLPYLRYRYAGSDELLEREELQRLLWLLTTHHSDGVVVWGTLHNLANRKSCLEFKDYLYTTLGPVLKCFHHMTKEDLQDIQRIFSFVSHRWSSSKEHDFHNKFYQYQVGVRNQTVAMFQDSWNHNQHVHLQSRRKKFYYDHKPLMQPNDHSHVLASEIYHRSRASNSINQGKEAERIITTKINPYLDSSELTVLSSIIRHYCSL